MLGWYVRLGALLLLIAALWAGYRWAYGNGVRDTEAAQREAALVATQGALDKADAQGRVDAPAALAATERVEGHRSELEERRGTVARADLTPAPPAGGSDAAALVCPDVLSGAFVRLYNGQTDDRDPGAPEAPAAAGVLGGRQEAGGAAHPPP